MGLPAAAQQLTLEQIVQQLTAAQNRNRASVRPHVSTRSYHVSKSGNERGAVTAVLHRPAPGQMSYDILASTGGVPEKAVRKSLEKEVQLTREPSISEMTPRNYQFTYLGREPMNGIDCYVLGISPHERGKELLKGKIWVDAQQFLVRRLEGSPSKNPSFWVKDVDLAMTFGEVKGVWLQLQSDVKLNIRFAGEYLVRAQNTSLSLSERPVEIAQKQRRLRRATSNTGAYLRISPATQR
jgi:hypothetical protein